MSRALRFERIAHKIFDSVNKAGGEVYISGIRLRDILFNEPSERTDVSIFYIPEKEFADILMDYGIVHKVSHHYELSTLEGYRFYCMEGYDLNSLKEHVKVSPRFTMEALIYDPIHHEMIDDYGAMNDIEEGILRIHNVDEFKKQLFNVFDTARLIACLDLEPANNTYEICHEMTETHKLSEVGDAYIYVVYSLILMSPQPSLGFNFLASIDALPKYLSDLITTPQRLDYHPEGSVWNHTMMVIDEAAWLKDRATNPLSFMWACLLHDIGKPCVTTIEGHARLHAEVGAQIFHDQITVIDDPDERSYIEWMIYHHMTLMWFAIGNESSIVFRRYKKIIENQVPLNDLILIGQADKLGRGHDSRDQIRMFNEYMGRMIDTYGLEAEPLLVNEEDLEKAGITDKWSYRELLDTGFEYQLKGMSKEDILRRLIDESRLY